MLFDLYCYLFYFRFYYLIFKKKCFGVLLLHCYIIVNMIIIKTIIFVYMIVIALFLLLFLIIIPKGST